MKAEVRNPSGVLTDCVVTDKADGTYDVEYTPFENGNTPAAPVCSRLKTHHKAFNLSQTNLLRSSAAVCLVVYLRRPQRPGSV